MTVRVLGPGAVVGAGLLLQKGWIRFFYGVFLIPRFNILKKLDLLFVYQSYNSVLILYVQEVVTLQKKYFIYLHQNEVYTNY